MKKDKLLIPLIVLVVGSVFFLLLKTPTLSIACPNELPTLCNYPLMPVGNISTGYVSGSTSPVYSGVYSNSSLIFYNIIQGVSFLHYYFVGSYSVPCSPYIGGCIAQNGNDYITYVQTYAFPQNLTNQTQIQEAINFNNQEWNTATTAPFHNQVPEFFSNGTVYDSITAVSLFSTTQCLNNFPTLLSNQFIYNASNIWGGCYTIFTTAPTQFEKLHTQVISYLNGYVKVSCPAGQYLNTTSQTCFTAARPQPPQFSLTAWFNNLIKTIQTLLAKWFAI